VVGGSRGGRVPRKDGERLGGDERVFGSPLFSSLVQHSVRKSLLKILIVAIKDY
jgi:hypothetical protein